VTDFDTPAADVGAEGTPSEVPHGESTGKPAAIAPEHYRATLGHFCSGITIVTAAGNDGPSGFTCQSFSALSLDPPLILLCPGKGSTSWPKIEAAGSFCVNILAEDQEELCRGFAMRGSDKFAGIGWTPGLSTGAPVIAGSLAWIECQLEATHDAGDHVVAVGRVLEMKAHDGRPLLFFRGGYGYGRFDI
jgi:3-hydroxy-9,10-secoandrosta-1,3,5(10)-triene-9,17-dione monooxygenase reductase component